MKRSPEDERLVRFLKQNRPEAPPPAADLEARILAATGRSPRPLRRWLPAASIAAALLWGTLRTLAPSSPKAAELAELEAFMLGNWQCSVSECDELQPFGERWLPGDRSTANTATPLPATFDLASFADGGDSLQDRE